MRCNRCHVTLHYCPCCGAAALTSEGGLSSAKGKGRSRTASTIAPTSSSAAASAGKANSEGGAWASRLPRRPVSAYEVFQAEQLELRERSRHTAGAAGLADEVLTSNSTGRTAESSQEEQRATAVAWLRLDATVKQRYEAAALRWASGLGDVDVGKTAATALGLAPSLLATPSLAAIVPAVELPVWGASARAPSAAEGPVTPTRPPLTPPSAKAPTKKSTPKKTTQSSVTVSSFALFRAAMKKRRWSMAQTTLSWERMTVEEKSRYDAAAAAYRTENFLPAAAEGTATTAPAPGPATSL